MNQLSVTSEQKKGFQGHFSDVLTGKVGFRFREKTNCPKSGLQPEENFCNNLPGWVVKRVPSNISAMNRHSALVLFLVLLGILHAQAQSPRNELQVGYGVGSATLLIEGIADVLASALVPGSIRSVDRTGTGPFIVGYNRYVSERFSVGLQGSYITSDASYTTTSGEFKGSNRYLTALLRGDYRWLNRGVQLYSGLGVGGSYLTSDVGGKSDNSLGVAFQVNALGVRVGKRVGAFAEAGFGFNGILTLGVSAKF